MSHVSAVKACKLITLFKNSSDSNLSGMRVLRGLKIKPPWLNIRPTAELEAGMLKVLIEGHEQLIELFCYVPKTISSHPYHILLPVPGTCTWQAARPEYYVWGA